MRDPARIPRVFELLRSLWEEHPDQRLGQLLLNVCRGLRNWPDLFDVEDDELMNRLKKAREDGF